MLAPLTDRAVRMPHTDRNHRAASGESLCETDPHSSVSARRRSPAVRSSSEISDRVRPAGLTQIVCLMMALAAPAAAADKVDVIHLKNGDRITCEIKKLDRSILSISTDPFGGASVHWGEVQDLQSPRTFDVQVSSGIHYFGVLLASPPGQMVLAL